MSVQLLAIKFNHDPGSATHDALNIRRNATHVVPVPEWQRGISVNPEDSPAAYAIAETQGNTITIQAQFRRIDPTLQAVEVRAVDAVVDPPNRGGCIGWLIALIRRLLRALFGNVLGEVHPRLVAFQPTGDTPFETFQLDHVRLGSAGVGVRTTSWRWQYRISPRDPWIDFAVSNHRIYALLATPTAPWQQTPYDAGNTQLPWTDALDYAGTWAFLAQSRDDAATRITRAVYELGPDIVEYDCPGGGSSQYASGGFNCTAFVERLKGGIGNGQYVNCTDCATFVATFANLVGCDLWQSQMGYFFDLNPGLSIGSALWQTACGWSGFSYHEVAWKDGCTATDAVFDACLQLDGDADPTVAPHLPLLPTNIVFGEPGDGVYRDRLATVAGRPACAPQPSTRQRRAVY